MITDVLELTDTVLVELSQSPTVTKMFPFLAEAQRLVDNVGRAKGCRKCEASRQKLNTAVGDLNALKQKIAVIPKGYKRMFKNLLKANWVRMRYRSTSGREITFKF